MGESVVADVKSGFQKKVTKKNNKTELRAGFEKQNKSIFPLNVTMMLINKSVDVGWKRFAFQRFAFASNLIRLGGIGYTTELLC